ncbi:restriction endonuclease [Desulfopila sp. IMCC35006]|uniref:McrC family protein n=1 Tax=Desulfopila sp. IMCC35006 TaxID=2569542 RepID=UPI0010ABBFD8|nr:McrC family protein [Desulfopila sp. IMCC35006]TKB26491.1 restriction endonuclease [Desulfopila sp. IMCC35006]
MPLLIREYGYLLREQDLSSPDEKAIAIPSADFDFLEFRLCSLGDDNEDRFFLKPALFKGRRSLQVQNHVGVLQTPSGTQIEILPKIYSGHGQELGPDQVRNILIRMLGYLRNSPFRQSDRALLADVSMPLIEVFVSYFLQQVNKLVKRGIRSDYVATQKNIGFMKGKLLVADQIRHNLVNQHRFYVEYDEFQVNRPENRLIRSALEKISAIVLQSRNQRLCRELLFAFDDVPPAADVRTDLGRCSKDRSMGYYEHVLDWCRIILLDQSPIGAAGATRSLSLLFPMERIFEDYVAARMRALHPSWQIRTQARDHYLMQQEGKNHFLMKPDLVLSRDKIKVVADTKWKLLGQDSSLPIHSSIGQADLYQMFAYGKKYLHDQQVKEVYLIYPKSANFTKPIEPFKYEDGFRLLVVPFDLSLDVDNLLIGENCFLA